MCIRDSFYRANDYRSMKGDPIEIQKNHVWKSSTSDRNNKIFQKQFGVELQPIFPTTKLDRSVNEKWSFCEKNHFLFSGQVKKSHWAILPKMGHKLNFGWIWHFYYLNIESKVLFTKKKHFLITGCIKNAKFSQNWVFGPFLAIWLNDIFLTWPENKKWFFSQKDHFSFTDWFNLVVGKIGCSTTPNCFWNILLLRSDVEDFQMWFFCTSMGSPFMLW